MKTKENYRLKEFMRMKKTLIVYFSRRGENYVNGSVKSLTIGNTEVVADMIKAATGGDMFYLEPISEYHENYYKCIEEAKIDLSSGARPEYKLDGAPISLESYEMIYLGYPNYWGTMPMHVYTFLESYDFEGKIIKPFCTHEGSGLGTSVSEIKKLCPNASVKSGLAIQGGNVYKSKSSVEKWINQ